MTMDSGSQPSFSTRYCFFCLAVSSDLQRPQFSPKPDPQTTTCHHVFRSISLNSMLMRPHYHVSHPRRLPEVCSGPRSHQPVLLHGMHPLNRQRLSPRAGMVRQAAALVLTALAPLGVFLPGPWMEGSPEELRELRPARSLRLASSEARTLNWLRSSSIP